MLVVMVVVLTILRLIVANRGSLGEHEALLMACARHPSFGYVEGPCGVPLLTSALLGIKGMIGVEIFPLLRCLPPLALLLLSWCLWQIARSMAHRDQGVAFWSVMGLNLLPWVNMASVVMDGSMVTASLILLSVASGLQAMNSGTKRKSNPVKKESPMPWILFGLSLGLTTLFYYPVGILLPMALVGGIIVNKKIEIPWSGMTIAFALLLLAWLPPLLWNARHDWIQRSSVAHGFDTYQIGNFELSLSVCIALSSLSLPVLIMLSGWNVWLRRGMLLLLLGAASMSAGILGMPSLLPADYPSPLGVQGVDELAQVSLLLRKERTDSKGREPFLIAGSQGVASLLGDKIHIAYPELPGAPGVFVLESPSLDSSYALWPSYADATALATKDLLYTEEKTVSPFLGGNALYITTESMRELPQAITGAFEAVGLLKEIMLTKNGRPECVRIYQCEHYRSLSL
jgi:hypothetical protein